MEHAQRRILQNNPLSKEETMSLRGMLVILIIIFHCSFYYGFTFPDLGHIAVSLFLFFSGYGLELSLHGKKGYLNGFLSNRIFGILVQYWAIVISIAVIGMLMYPGSDPWDEIASALFRTPHWFVVEILAFYILFYLTSTLLRDRGRIRILATVVCTFLLMFLMFRYYGSALYYLSGSGFAFGILWYHVRDRIGTNGILTALCIIIPMVILTLIDGRGDRGIPDMMRAALACISSIALLIGLQSIDLRKGWPIHIAILIIGLILFFNTDVDRESASFMVFASLCAILTQIEIPSKVFAFLGVMSFEMYLMHETFYLYVWRNITQYEPLAFVISLMCAVIASYIVYRISNLMIGKMRESLSSERGVEV